MGLATSTGEVLAAHRPRPATTAGAADPAGRTGVGDGPSPLGYQPALDGIRAVALGGVLLFHHGYNWVPGGFLGVSTFFTLSGFLITTLALTEWAGTGRLSPARFYERRARRLLPAALLTFAGILVLRTFTDVGAGDAFRGDVLAALGYVANWRFAATEHSYAAVFAEPSPVLHFWSLAIEEQFYLAFPPLFVAVMAVGSRLARRRQGGAPAAAAAVARTLAGGFMVLAACAAFAVAYSVAERNGNDGTTYYGTHTRAGELLGGVALAFVARSSRFRRLVATRAARLALQLAGPAALVGLAWTWHEASLDGARLFKGVTVLNTALSCVLIVAALHRGTASAALGLWPLRGLGKISYAAYLFHWPVFLWLEPPRVHLGPDRLFALRLVVTCLAATASYHLLEAPFRFRLRMPRPRLAAGFAVAAALTAAVVAVASRDAVQDTGFAARIDVPAAGDAAGAAGADDEAGPMGDYDTRFPFLRMHGVVRPVDGADPVARILIAGDSMPVSLIVGLQTWNDDHPDRQIWVDSHTAMGCPMVDTGVSPMEVVWPTMPECVRWHRDLAGVLTKWDTDVVFFQMGLADLQGHKIDGEMVDLGRPEHDDWFRERVDQLADTLTAPGMPVVWSTFPHVRFESSWEPTKSWEEYPMNEPWRVERLNSLVMSEVAGRPGITTVDMDAWIRSWQDPFDPALRDGVHFLDEGSVRVGDWLVPQLIAAAGVVDPAVPAGGP